ncbi:MAG: DUF1294 domain-containing protein [Eubacteriales bacterium]|nr:DUF1294 domain-containing protein [Eubacteriales bacterium]
MNEWIYLLIGWNAFTLLIMGLDKFLAIHEKRRISERTLLTLAFAMGGIGSLLGSIVFRHKTRKWGFRILLPIALLFNASVIFLIWYYVL